MATKIFSAEYIGSQSSDLRDTSNIEFGRLYKPIDDLEGPKATLYHIELRKRKFLGLINLKGAVTVEVRVFCERDTIDPEYREYRIDYRIIGVPRNIRWAKAELEKMTGLKLIDDDSL